MTLIAHLSDLHLLEDDHHRRDAAGRFRLSFLSFGRSLDAQERRQRLRAALFAYRSSDAEHLVITGDLTEDGTAAQFEVLAEVLLDSGLHPSEVTLVPGNHDAYCAPSAFTTALQGPLRLFRSTSGTQAMTVLDDVVLLPISTLLPQPITRSAGVVSAEHLQRAQRVSAGFKGSGKAIALAQHHQPYAYPVPAFTWIDGLQNHDSVMGLLSQHRELHVLHGHRHRCIDRRVADVGPARLFGTTACVEDPTPLRIYEASDGRLWPLDPPRFSQRPLLALGKPLVTVPV